MKNFVIANSILALLKEHPKCSNLQIKVGKPIAYKIPLGMKRLDEIVTSDDFEAFAEFSNPKYKLQLEKLGGSFSEAFNLGDDMRLRASFFFGGGKNNLSVAIRVHPIAIPSLEELGVDPKLKMLLFQNKQGLILVSGPTNAGKSTTQFSLIDYMNKTSPLHIETIEEPIEFVLVDDMSEITQREVPTDVPTFGQGVREMKRHNPDLIMIGEMMDRETVDAMLKIANSGHLVIAGTHAQSAEESIKELLQYYSGEELELKRSQLAASLLAATSQRILPSTDGKSNIMVYDLLIKNPQVAKAISDGNMAALKSYMASDAKGESVSFNETLAKKVLANKIKITDAFSASSDTTHLQRLCGGQKPSM